MRLLYFPGVAGGLILGCELSFWTLHIDPLLSIVLSAVPAYFFGKWFTENIFAQKPLVTQARRAPRSADASQPAPPHPGPARHAGAVPQVQRADDRLLRRLLLRQDRRRDRAEGAARGRARGQVRDVQREAHRRPRRDDPADAGRGTRGEPHQVSAVAGVGSSSSGELLSLGCEF